VASFATGEDIVTEHSDTARPSQGSDPRS
jgi:hypothetical protein